MRLKSELWVKAYLRLCHVNDAPAFVTRRGQADGGAIYIKVDRLNGHADLYAPAPAGLGTGSDRLWAIDPSHREINHEVAEAYLARQIEFDNDIWIVEVEDRDGRHFLGKTLVEV